MRLLITLALALAAAAPAMEIATGKMLGPGHDARSFYVRQPGGKWTKTYSSKQFRPEAAGRLMNLRIAQAIVHDEWLTEAPFDPEKNTSRVIEALDDYKKHGIIAISTSLQGANAAYELTPNIKRLRPYKLGPGKGMSMSAFRPDGSLKPEWMARALRLSRELDKREMALELLIFYAYQDEIFKDTNAIDTAVRNVADWIVANNVRNVIIEIANEIDGGDFDHDRYIEKNLGKLMAILRDRMKEKGAKFTIPVTTSTIGRKEMSVPDDIYKSGDLVLIHGNNRTVPVKIARLKELAADTRIPGPVVMNEDNNGRDTTLENLKAELGSCDAMFDNGASWGYMPWRQLQIFPFRFYRPGPSSRVTDDMPVDQRDPAYFKAVLEHIQKRVYR